LRIFGLHIDLVLDFLPPRFFSSRDENERADSFNFCGFARLYSGDIFLAYLERKRHALEFGGFCFDDFDHADHHCLFDLDHEPSELSDDALKRRDQRKDFFFFSRGASRLCALCVLCGKNSFIVF
jgi:hypothetical protein